MEFDGRQRLITFKELAKRRRVDPRTVYTWAARGLFTTIRIGRRSYVPASDLRFARPGSYKRKRERGNVYRINVRVDVTGREWFTVLETARILRIPYKIIECAVNHGTLPTKIKSRGDGAFVRMISRASMVAYREYRRTTHYRGGRPPAPKSVGRQRTRPPRAKPLWFTPGL